MGAEQSSNGAWDRVRQLAEKLESHHADKVYVAKEYTKADLRRDLLASIPAPITVVWATPDDAGEMPPTP